MNELDIVNISEYLGLTPNYIREILALPPEPKDDCYDESGQFLPRGRCDTCGAPCDSEEGFCTEDRSHKTAIDISEIEEGDA
jgi:hypothetical protein